HNLSSPSLLILLLDLAPVKSSLSFSSGRYSSVSRLCPAGCATCSALNGCLSCIPRLFFHLELDGMRQRGACLSSCPRGHYGMRSPHISTCTRCKVDCASCFSENFCTHCHPGHFLFQGKCANSCPYGLTANTMRCQIHLHCEVGEWTGWGPCVQKRSMRAYRRGQETRNRQLLRSPSDDGDPCPHVSEIRKCVIKMRPKSPSRLTNNHALRLLLILCMDI
uniref:R-spondin 3 n=1 Tax=Sander lucioperca TaxID=283035 RepID=A0A8C9ZQH1_SANLU